MMVNVKELCATEATFVVDYFLNAPRSFLQTMGTISQAKLDGRSFCRSV